MGAAAGSVAATDVVLNCNQGWSPAIVLPHIPTDGFTGSDHHNVAALPSGRTLGDVVRYYDATAEGWVELIYGQMGDASGVAVAAGAVMRPAGSTDNSDEEFFVLNNDPDDAMFSAGIGPAAIALSAMTADYYGWFWCGGKCPQATNAFCSTLAAASIVTYLDAGNSAASAFCAGDASGTDQNGLVEPSSYLQTIFGWIHAALGATAT